MKFRLGTIAYVFALLVAGMAAFGAVAGFFTASFVGLSWLWVIRPRDWGGVRPRLVAALICWLLVALTIGVLIPSVSIPREVSRSAACMRGIKQLAFGALAYHDEHGMLPPAVLADDQGRLLHSWRTLILPSIDQRALFKQVDLTLPWNHPRNASVAQTIVNEMNCASRSNNLPKTSYFAVTGEQAVWSAMAGKSLKEMSDGSSETILILENWQKRNSWSQPSDLTFDEALAMLTTSPGSESGHVIDLGYFYKPSVFVSAAFADGSVKSLRLPLPRELAVALLTCEGGEAVVVAELQRMREPEIDFATLYAFVVFVSLALWPGVWVLRRAKTPPV